jgi:hypothetical protein
VQPNADDGEPDDLSPHRANEHSVEKSRRVVGTVSSTPDDMDDEPDELSMLAPDVASKTPRRTPIADSTGSMAVMSTRHSGHGAKPTDLSPTTPNLLSNRRSRRSSASRLGREITTPAAPRDAEDSEDELSPPMNTSTPQVIAQGHKSLSTADKDTEDEVDELSSPAPPVSSAKPPRPSSARKSPKPRKHTTQPSVARKARRIVVDEEDPIQPTPAPTESQRTRISLSVPAQADDDEDAPDEISPEANRITQHPSQVSRLEADVSSAEESDSFDPVTEAAPLARNPQTTQTQKPASGEPPRKRQRFGGPKRAISVMRIKGSTVRGITVADTTRTILEQHLDHRISRMVEKLPNAQDSSRRKQIRAEINLAFAFKESLDEKLLDLQDANDTLSTGFQKRRLLKNMNAERRTDILALQNNRQEVALEMDHEQAVFDAEKKRIDAKNKLSANMFEIQAAIQSGRERARQQGRENEGPEIPLSMLLETVGRNVGSMGGGLLAGIRQCNSALERAAGWLEGRA